MRICLTAAWLLLIVGCSGGAKNLPVGSYERGVAEFESEHYFEAIEDLKLFVRRNPTDPKVDEAQYHVGLSRFQDGDYPVAAVEFEILRTDYPNSARVEDAWYMEGLCYRKQVPSIERDQTITEKALGHFRRYLSQFPNGTRRDDAQAQVDELQELLDRKRLAAVQLYQRLGRPKAALVTLKALMGDRSDSKLMPEMLLRAGELSLQLKDDPGARDYFERLVANDPDGEFGQRARRRLERIDAGGGDDGSSR